MRSEIISSLSKLVNQVPKSFTWNSKINDWSIACLDSSNNGKQNGIHTYTYWHSMEENKMNVGENDVILQKLRCMESSPRLALPSQYIFIWTVSSQGLLPSLHKQLKPVFGQFGCTVYLISAPDQPGRKQMYH